MLNYSSISRILNILIILCLTASTIVFAAPVHAAAEIMSPPVTQLLNSDGTLDLSLGYSGILDTTDYNINLDPIHGPILKPLTVLNSWNALGTGLNGSVQVIAISGADVYVGGEFTDAGGVAAADRIAKFSGGTWSALGTGLNATVYALAVSGTDVYAGGDFTDAGGVAAADHIAKFSTGSWSALGTGLNNFVGGIAISGTDVYAGGSFTDAGGISDADHIAKFSAGSWSALGSGLNSDVITIAISGADVYAGGYFTDADGVANADRIAKFSSGTWSALGTGLNSTVLEIAISGGDIYAIGGFTDAGGIEEADRIAKFSGGSWSALGSGLNSQAGSIAINGGDVYVGGSFTDAGGVANADYIAKFSNGAWSALGTTPLNNNVTSIVMGGGDVYAGGYFQDAGGATAADHIARFELPRPVNTANDAVLEDNLCSLREAIINANNDALTHDDCNPGAGNDTIAFADGITTITLGSTLPTITDPDGLTINGGGDITVSGNSLYRIMIVDPTIPLALTNLTVADGACTSCLGGGVYNNGALTITNSTFSNNGEGVYNNNGTVTITNSIFSGNGSIYGGGVDNASGTLIITNSTFTGNIASSGGGSGVYTAGTATITNSTFTNNTGSRGSIYNDGPTTIANSTFSGNVGTNGGGGVYNQSTLTITNSTFSGNTAPAGLGGDIYQTEVSSTLNLYNNILANSAGGNCVSSDGTVTGDHNLIEDAASACGFTHGVNSNVVGFDPDLGALQGSPAYFPLNSSSPALNTGSDIKCAGQPVSNTSQNGLTRPQGSHCDIGSYEFPIPTASVNISISNNPMGTYVISPNDYKLQSYPGTFGGPLFVDSTNNVPNVASIRLLYLNRFGYNTMSELMGVPTAGLLDNYWMPVYLDNAVMDSQIRFTNTSPTLSTDVSVYIGGVLKGTYTLAPNSATRVRYEGFSGGPVQIVGTPGVPILAGMRIIYAGGNSFDEIMAYPNTQLSNEYWFPFYNHNNVNLDTEIRIGNTNPTLSSTVNIYIGGALKGTYTLAPNTKQQITYAGFNGGPVRIVGTSGVNLVTSIRLLYLNRFGVYTLSELMGVPTAQLLDNYAMPVYLDNTVMDSQVRFTNTSTTLSTTVEVYLGDSLMNTYVLPPSSAERIRFTGVSGGPVRIVGTPGVPILAGMRIIYAGGNSFDEIMAYPTTLLSPEYWFPFYNHNNVNLDTEVRIGVP